MDEYTVYGIQHCHSRYDNADIDEEAKHPKLLPRPARNNYFTCLLILEVHGRLAHAGIAHTLNSNTFRYVGLDELQPHISGPLHVKV